MSEQAPKQDNHLLQLDIEVRRLVSDMMPRIIELVRMELAKPDKKYRKYLETIERLEEAGPRDRARDELMDQLWSYYGETDFTTKKAMELAPELVRKVTGMEDGKVSLGMAFNYAAKTGMEFGDTRLTISGRIGATKTKIWRLKKRPARD